MYCNRKCAILVEFCSGLLGVDCTPLKILAWLNPTKSMCKFGCLLSNGSVTGWGKCDDPRQQMAIPICQLCYVPRQRYLWSL
jgi:hypothetical protein